MLFQDKEYNLKMEVLTFEGVYNKLHMFVAIGEFYSFEGLTSLAKICRLG